MLDFFITDSEAERLLLNRTAAILFGVAACLSFGVVVLWFVDLNYASLTAVEREIFSWSGAALAIGCVCLWAGMLLFWLKCDTSPVIGRKIWFLALLLGALGAMPYYVLVYLPAVRRKLRKPRSVSADEPPRPDKFELGSGELRGRERRKLIGPFGWVLFIGWALFVLFIAVGFAFPKIVFRPFAGDDRYVIIWLWMVALMISTPIYAIVLLFRAGMRRSARSSSSDPPKNA